jgi:hypothetical protein
LDIIPEFLVILVQFQSPKLTPEKIINFMLRLKRNKKAVYYISLFQENTDISGIFNISVNIVGTKSGDFLYTFIAQITLNIRSITRSHNLSFFPSEINDHVSTDE